MYQKPEVKRFGSLRELTLIGCSGDGDIIGFFINGNPGFDCSDGGNSGRS